MNPFGPPWMRHKSREESTCVIGSALYAWRRHCLTRLSAAGKHLGTGEEWIKLQSSYSLRLERTPTPITSGPFPKEAEGTLWCIGSAGPVFSLRNLPSIQGRHHQSSDRIQGSRHLSTDRIQGRPRPSSDYDRGLLHSSSGSGPSSPAPWTTRSAKCPTQLLVGRLRWGRGGASPSIALPLALRGSAAAASFLQVYG